MSDQVEYISIIIPAYNSEKWLARCMDSVLAAADVNCEVIVVDDASTDSTLQMAQDYEDKDARVLVLALDEHGGADAARRAGVHASQGDSIVFVDSDDILPKESIAELRHNSEPGAEIVIGNLSIMNPDGTSRLVQSGPRREYSRDEFLEIVMVGGIYYRLVGKKISRKLFDRIEWDTHPLLGASGHRYLLINLASKIEGHVVIAPACHTYIYMRRPWSLSSMLQLRTEGIARLWQDVAALDNIPEDLLMRWGLNAFKVILLDRGIPFDNEFPPAVELRALCRRYPVENEEQQRTVKLLNSRSERLKYARKNVREGKLTTVAPHLSFVLVMHNDFSAVERTINSILDTGFRNIEIVVVDDASNSDDSVKLNAMNIRYPRMVIEKNHNRVGMAKSRMIGSRVASGLALMILTAGSEVEPDGILAALNYIDSGTDLVFMGYDRPNWGGLFRNEYDPSSVTAVGQGANRCFESIVAFGDLNPARYAFLINREYAAELRGKFVGGVEDMEHFTLILLNYLQTNPSVWATGSVGLHLPTGTVRNTIQHMHEQLEKGEHVLDFLEKCGLADAAHRRAVGMGIHAELIKLLARCLSIPIVGKIRARRLVRRMLKDEPVIRFYKRVGLPLPKEEDIMIKAQAYFRRHRFAVTGAWLTGC